LHDIKQLIYMYFFNIDLAEKMQLLDKIADVVYVYAVLKSGQFIR